MPYVSLSQMVAALKRDRVLVSFPTDTVPALATRPEHAELIYEAKRRPPEKPLILMGASLEDLLPYVTGDTAALAEWKALSDQHWPGQLTLVLPASDRTPPTLNPASTGTLGIRVPNHPTALALLSRSGPLATTSANLSGQPPLVSAGDIARTFPSALILPADASTPTLTSSGTPSTVAQWTAGGWKILRQGKVHL
ncbi:MAG: L-threonylcarbamoyladenylate synthase [Phormidesmis sp.]